MSLFTDTTGAQHRRVGGVLRVANGAWELANDTDYQSDDLTLGAIGASTITLTFPPALKIVSFRASPDAQFAQNYGASFGVDAELDQAVIRGRLMTGLLYFNSWSNTSTAIHVEGWLLHQTAEPVE